jgi:1-deoxy-D-xylulose 5-phosphate reductoisomerase
MPPALDDTLGLLREAHELLDPDALATADNAALVTQLAAGFALVAIGMNLERITSALEALVESGNDLAAGRQALQTIASEVTSRG